MMYISKFHKTLKLPLSNSIVTSIQESSITCDTMPLTGIDTPITDLVNFSIDLALILNESVQFMYAPNPQITNVDPSSTIPA